MAHVLPNFASGRRARPLCEVRQKATGGGAEVMGVWLRKSEAALRRKEVKPR